MICLVIPRDRWSTPLGRRGFTLIELMTASVLAAVLIGGVVMAAGVLGRDARRAGAVDPASQFDAGASVIRRDLCNAQSAEFRPDGSIVLVGHGGLDPATGRATGRLVRIEYRLIDVGRRSSGGGGGESQGRLLVREQVLLDVSGEGKPWRELVSAGVTNFQMTPASGESAPAFSEAAAAAPVRRPMVPARVRVRIENLGGASERVIDVR